jgi:hypothetical protein
VSVGHAGSVPYSPVLLVETPMNARGQATPTSVAIDGVSN